MAAPKTFKGLTMKIEVEFLKKHYRYKPGDIIAVPRNMAKALESLKLVKMADTAKVAPAPVAKPKPVVVKTPSAVKPPKPAKAKQEGAAKKSAGQKPKNKAESATAAE